MEQHLSDLPGRWSFGGDRRGADHEAGKFGRVGVGHQQRGGNRPPTAKHCGFIAETCHLVELVADEHHGAAVIGHVSQYGAQLVGLSRGKDRRRLVQHQDPGVAPQRLEDLDPLALPHRELPYRPVGFGGQAESIGQCTHR